MEPIRLPSPCLVVLIGPSGAGKSTWAAGQFEASQVVSTDGLRSLVGEGEADQAASKDAFDLLDDIIVRRLRRRLTTVIDSTGLEAPTRARWRALAAAAGVGCFAMVFAVEPRLVRERNTARDRQVPPDVLRAQLRAFETLVGPDGGLDDEGFAGVYPAGPVRLGWTETETADAASGVAGVDRPMRFGLQVQSFTWPGGPAEIGPHLAALGRAAEEAGFADLWLMDHFRQIPQAGPVWADMLESYTTLGFLAAATETIRLGTMVSGVTYRNVAHLGKIIATLDVLSGGRANCGLGAAWFEAEHRAYGWDFPSTRARLDLLEDALQLLPLLWGKGSPSFTGKVISVPEAMCYPRPLQAKIPILVGGSGERRTLRLVARYADACNLFGDSASVAHKVAVLRRHCDEVGRPFEQISVTQLSTTLVGRDSAELATLVERQRPKRMSAERFGRTVNAGTIDDQLARFRALGRAGVDTIIVSLPDAAETAACERFAPIIDALG